MGPEGTVVNTNLLAAVPFALVGIRVMLIVVALFGSERYSRRAFRLLANRKR
jgi:hypothetical protein